PGARQVDQLRRGTIIEGVRTAPAEITELESGDTNGWFKITLHQGRNQQIRKMFDSIGHSVMKLRRVRIGPLTDEGLKPGHFRLLRDVEVKRFKNIEPDRKVTRKGAAQKRGK